MPDAPTVYVDAEFAVLLPNTSLLDAVEVARVVQTRIQHLQLPHRQSKVSEYVTASFGVVCMVPNTQTPRQELVIQADRALYQAKIEGRDRIFVI